MAQQQYDDKSPYRQFETSEEARDRRRGLVENLNKSKDDAHHKLARKLDDCSTDEPCRSGACPSCMRATRIDWISKVENLVENEWRRS